MKYYLIAGEASGDLHGANLMRALGRCDAGARFRFWGGDHMAAVAGPPAKHIRELAFMGFVEVLANLPTILRNFKTAKKDILAFEPDVLILIDYPGFNLRMAKWAKQRGIRVFFYISPQLWAWKAGRIKTIEATVERLFVILPFEEDWYRERNFERVDFVGHPLLDVVDDRERSPDFHERFQLDTRPIIALLPGSRVQEIRSMLSVMLELTDQFREHQFVIAGAPAVDRSVYDPFLKKHPSARLIDNRTYDLLQHATAALVTSGTATLETALFGVPEVVCYRGSRVSVAIARRLVNIEYISLVNLIMDRPVVRELIQNDLSAANLAHELRLLLSPERRLQLKIDYELLRDRLGGPGASQRTAELMTRYLTEAPAGV